MEFSSHQDIIALWPSIAVLASEVNKKETTVHAWRNRNSIPDRHFPDVIAAAERRGITAVTDVILRATSKDAWRYPDMQSEVNRIMADVELIENRLTSALPRQMAMAKLRGETRLPSLAGAERCFQELKRELSSVASAFGVSK